MDSASSYRFTPASPMAFTSAFRMVGIECQGRIEIGQGRLGLVLSVQHLRPCRGARARPGLQGPPRSGRPIAWRGPFPSRAKDQCLGLHCPLVLGPGDRLVQGRHRPLEIPLRQFQVQLGDASGASGGSLSGRPAPDPQRQTAIIRPLRIPDLAASASGVYPPAFNQRGCQKLFAQRVVSVNSLASVSHKRITSSRSPSIRTFSFARTCVHQIVLTLFRGRQPSSEEYGQNRRFPSPSSETPLT